jgi:hypothetical protein
VTEARCTVRRVGLLSQADEHGRIGTMREPPEICREFAHRPDSGCVAA